MAGHGGLSLSKGDVVEVVENSGSSEWSLVRTVGRMPCEGWMPKDLIAPCNFAGNSRVLQQHIVVMPKFLLCGFYWIWEFFCIF